MSTFMSARLIFALGAATLLTAAVPAAAQQITYDFDDLALNTPVTTQYPGVTFSVLPQSCGGSTTLYMRTRVPTGGTSSGTKALGIDTGCPDFSPDYLRMVFDNPQGEVTFMIGDWALDYTIRAYSTTSGSTGLLSTQNLAIGGSGGVGVHRFVTVSSAGDNIRRIEVQTPVGLFEWIDDLSFELDGTPPIARIAAPSAAACQCTTVQVRGSAYDPDGTYARDRLEYRAAPNDAWTLIDDATTPVEDGPLYNWNSTGLAEGFYFIKLTVENTVGLSSTDTALVWLSGDFDTVAFTVPPVVGGTVHPDGTVWDEYCTGTYTVNYSVVPPGLYQPIDPAHPSYDGYKVNEQLGVWDPASLPDGNYVLRVSGNNTCGNGAAQTHTLALDNTPPFTLITTPTSCSSPDGPILEIRGTATDSHFAGWTLEMTGGADHVWVPLASGATPVVNQLLARINISGLPDCEYTIRLVAEDSAVRNGDPALHNRSEYTVSFFVGCEGDFNRDGVVNSQDFFDFLNVFFSGCP